MPWVGNHTDACASARIHNVWVVVKIMVPFLVPMIIRHLIFRVPQKGTLILITPICRGSRQLYKSIPKSVALRTPNAHTMPTLVCERFRV